VTSEARPERRDVDACVGFVDDLDVDINIGTQYPPFGAIRRDAVNSGQRI
jgi:hypothetical protein